MKNINNSNKEQVEVMALFGYEMTPCQPLSFKRHGERDETEVTELLKTHIRFLGDAAMHVFDVLAGRDSYRLEFNSVELTWHLTRL